ncbi:hypothetical protein COO60DRAFT_237607 [Scenedesmus sp. NREL 46B-D3]|nr:hypothetical protein COO60DRAFT_237607 [Scenedesmus sp. NREL 46B-D3]
MGGRHRAARRAAVHGQAAGAGSTTGAAGGVRRCCWCLGPCCTSRVSPSIRRAARLRTHCQSRRRPSSSALHSRRQHHSWCCGLGGRAAGATAGCIPCAVSQPGMLLRAVGAAAAGGRGCAAWPGLERPGTGAIRHTGSIQEGGGFAASLRRSTAAAAARLCRGWCLRGGAGPHP